VRSILGLVGVAVRPALVVLYRLFVDVVPVECLNAGTLTPPSVMMLICRSGSNRTVDRSTGTGTTSTACRAPNATTAIAIPSLDKNPDIGTAPDKIPNCSMGTGSEASSLLLDHLGRRRIARTSSICRR
jgi:hypothetical protein